MKLFITFAILLLLFLALLTHIGYCAIMGKYVFMFTGAFLFPIGILHGFSLWGAYLLSLGG